MAINDQNIATLRSFLTDEYQVWSEKAEELLTAGNAENYGVLIHAAFTRAAYRKFSPSWSLPDVIRFVGKVRSDLAPTAHNIDALAAEKLLCQSIGDESVRPDELASLDIETVAVVEGVLLQAMVWEAGLDEAGLTEFIDDVTLHANEWLAAQRTTSPSESDSILASEGHRSADASVRRDTDHGPWRDQDGGWVAL